jgi:hypothetical protein
VQSGQFVDFLYKTLNEKEEGIMAKRQSGLWGIAAVILIMAAGLASVSAMEIAFTDDFSAWTVTAWSSPSGYEPGAWLATSNTDCLSWNLTTNAGSWNRGKYYKYTATQQITKIEFDWRFSNDQFDSRLAFKLLDDADNVLWTATSTAGAQTKPVTHAVVNAATTSIKFSYIQLVDPIYGKPAFFDASNQDDWDAYVDNVTLTLTMGCTQALKGDINKDCVVNFKDLSVLIADWLLCDKIDPTQCP